MDKKNNTTFSINDNSNLKSSAPDCDLKHKWTQHKFNLKLVNPSNKRKYKVIVVGTGLAGASAAASMAELGYSVKAFSFMNRLEELIVLQLKVVLMQQKIIKTMEIAYFVCSTILLREAITEQEKQMFIVWQNSVLTLLINVQHKEYHLLESMEDIYLMIFWRSSSI